MKNLSFSLLFLFPSLVFGQKNLTNLTDYDYLVKADSLAGEEKYKQAIDYYGKVSENDTLYEYGLKRIWRCQNDLEKYDDALKTCQRMIDHDNKEVIDGYLGLSVTYRKKKMFKEAIAASNAGLKRYPRAESLYMELGVSHRENGEHAIAYEMFKKACISDMYSSRAFLNLAIAAAQNGKNAQALLAIATAIFVNPESPDALDYLVTMEKMAQSEYEKKNEGMDLNVGENFDLINEIFDSRRALNRDYKIKLKINTYAARQLHMIVKNKGLISDVDEDGFFTNRLLPFYEKIVNDNEINKLNMIFLLTSQNEDAVKKIKKSKSALIFFYAKAKADYNTKVSQQYIEFEGKKQMVFCGYSAGSREGLLQNEKEIGNWYYYNRLGELAETGKFNNEGERTGTWKVYSKGGVLSTIVNYENGELNGDYIDYYLENGQPKSLAVYKDGDVDGILTQYYINGTTRAIYNIKNNNAEGVIKTFHSNGKILQQKTILNDIITGNEDNWYANGQNQGTYKYNAEGDIEGEEKYYYASGNLFRTSIRKKGFYEGEVIEYYDVKDKVKSKKNFKNGKLAGEQLEYRFDGSLKSRSKYSEKGKETGTEENFNLDGSPSLTIEYKKGEVVEIVGFYNKGKKSEKFTRKNSKINYQLFYPDGTKSLDAIFTDDGRDGEAISYNPYGVVVRKETYAKGKQIGKEFGYYNSGKLKYVNIYNDGELDGLALTYFQNGTLKTEIRYIAGRREGTKYVYYPNGEISEKAFYVKGELSGNMYSYAQNGKPTTIEKYEQGEIKNIKYLDSLGNVIYERKYQDTIMEFKGIANETILKKVHFLNTYFDGPYELFYPNKSVLFKGQYLAGNENGDWVWYHPNGQKSKECTYVMGEQNGMVRNYALSGFLESEEFNYNAEGNGTFTEYYQNGKVKRKFTQIEDDRHGDSYYYSPDGELRYIRSYFDGKIVAYKYLGTKGDTITIELKSGLQTIKTYYKNGKISNEQTRNNGQLEGKYIDYYTNGKVQEVNNFVNDDEEGEAIAYYESGAIAKSYFNKDGYMNGISKTFSADGKALSSINYVMGELHGKCMWMDKNGKMITINYYYDEIVK
jgi:uncharacterized protein